MDQDKDMIVSIIQVAFAEGFQLARDIQKYDLSLEQGKEEAVKRCAKVLLIATKKYENVQS